MARLQPEFFVQQFPGLPVRLERVRLPARAVEREHQLAAQPLLHRVREHQRLQLADELGAFPPGQVGLDPVGDHRSPHLVQPPDLCLRELQQGQVGECRPSPQVEGLAKLRGGCRCLAGIQCLPSLGREAFEPAHVDLLRIGAQQVAPAFGDEHAGATVRWPRVEQPPQPRHRGLERVDARPGPVATGQLVDDPVGRYEFVGMQEQQAEQRALPLSAHRQRRTVSEDLQRPEQMELEPGHIRFPPGHGHDYRATRCTCQPPAPRRC